MIKAEKLERLEAAEAQRLEDCAAARASQAEALKHEPWPYEYSLYLFAPDNPLR